MHLYRERYGIGLTPRRQPYRLVRLRPRQVTESAPQQRDIECVAQAEAKEPLERKTFRGVSGLDPGADNASWWSPGWGFRRSSKAPETWQRDAGRRDTQLD